MDRQIRNGKVDLFRTSAFEEKVVVLIEDVAKIYEISFVGVYV